MLRPGSWENEWDSRVTYDTLSVFVIKNSIKRANETNAAQEIGLSMPAGESIDATMERYIVKKYKYKGKKLLKRGKTVPILLPGDMKTNNKKLQMPIKQPAHFNPR